MLKIINPATEELVRELPEDDARTVAEKFTRAKKAQPAWADRPLSDRTAILKKFLDSVIADKEKLAQILTSETGKPVAQARNELNALSGRIGFFLENTASTIAPETVLNDPTQKLEEKITHEPLGVIGNISAWNYPYFVGSNVFVPALLTGNAVLYKPSEFATLTGLEIERLLGLAGVPKEVFSVLVGGGAVGSELLKQPLNGVYFTGSYPTGVKIAEAASRSLMRTQLELGGKDPIYICEDVDVASVAEGTADGAFYNSGQSCCSVERIYVHAKVFDSYVENFIKTVRGFVTGDPREDGTYIGPLTRKAQISVLEAQIADALKKGATLLCGGKAVKGRGYYFEPTVLIGVNHSMDVMREESFGPIIGIQKVQDDEEAIRLMNDTAYGLTAGVYTKDAGRAKKLLARVNAGSAYWNCCDRVSPRLPWSGRGHSGVGSTLSKYGILAFVQPKGWHLRSV
jgi:acyl-CoA reductase-like NAD-dependent aldehyde dehydrogenase